MDALNHLICAATTILVLTLGVTAADAGEKLPNGGRPEVRSPFPSVANWNSLDITLRRQAGMEAEPEYFVEIHGDGTVLFEGNDDVAAPGKHTIHISAARVHALYTEFKRADFFGFSTTTRFRGLINPPMKRRFLSTATRN
ncbi:MAG: DUF6438 domain-containing protein [Rhizomicrobium sp.]|jgi:hypothetical protein